MTVGRLASRHRAHHSPAVTTRTGRGPRRPAAVAALSYALVSGYWASAGHALISTVGGYAAQAAHRGGAAPVLLALAAAVAKAIGGLLALALVRPWGRVG